MTATEVSVRELHAERLMESFAEETGLSGDKPPRRYLWTDAFAVCNYLALRERTGDARFLELALRLVDQVHHVLGRHREDDARSGWISGLGEEEGRRRPTAGGLRIGKPLRERGPGEPHDARLEWDRDGQYYHYLTRWMHALARVAATTGEGWHHRRAVDLARAAHRGFTRPAGDGRKRMVWKMSVDLSRPLVDSMGHHDPLDGLVTMAWLRATRPPGGGAEDAGELEEEIRELGAMCEGRSWATDDPLSVGGLLVDTYRVAVLTREGRSPRRGLVEELLGDSARSLEALARSGAFELPSSYRLPFRELGFTIGLAAVEKLRNALAEDPVAFGPEPVVRPLVEQLAGYAPVRREVEDLWLDPRAREGETWTAHEDINMVMLATSLVPEGYLGS